MFFTFFVTSETRVQYNVYYAPINDLHHSPPHAGKGGDRLGINLIVEVI